MKNEKIAVILISLCIGLLFILDSPKAVNKFTDEFGLTRQENSGVEIDALDGYKKIEKDTVTAVKGDPERFNQAAMGGPSLTGDKLTEPGEVDQDQELNVDEFIDEDEIPASEDLAQDIITTEAQDDQNTQVLAGTAKVTPPISVLMIGDSLFATGFGPRLETDLKSYKGVKVYREGRYSTGLNRTDYYNWSKRLDQLNRQFKPDVIIVFFGANDGQNIKDSKGRTCKLYASCWEGIYSQRVYDFMAKASKYGKQVYWIGHPIPKTSNFNKKFQVMNKVYGAQSKKFSNVTFINLWNRFAVNGRYSAYVKNNAGVKCSAKNGDGVHLSICGAKIASDHVIPIMKKNMELVKK